MNEIRADIHTLIKNKDWKKLKKELNDLDKVQSAKLIEKTSGSDQIILFRLLNRKLAKGVFQLLSFSEQEQIIDGLVERSYKLSRLINDLEPDDRTAFFEELPAKVTQRLIQLLSPEERRVTMQLLGYPEDSIGRIMTPEYVVVKPEYSIKQTFEHIRIYGKDSETLNVIYVVDDDWKLIDDIRIKEILLASPD